MKKEVIEISKGEWNRLKDIEQCMYDYFSGQIKRCKTCGKYIHHMYCCMYCGETNP